MTRLPDIRHRTTSADRSDRRTVAASARRLATLLLWVLVAEHLFALGTPPYRVGIEQCSI